MKKQVNQALALGGILALVLFVVVGLTGSADERAKRPTIKKLGTLDLLLMVETTPVVGARPYSGHRGRAGIASKRPGRRPNLAGDTIMSEQQPQRPHWKSSTGRAGWTVWDYYPHGYAETYPHVAHHDQEPVYDVIVEDPEPNSGGKVERSFQRLEDAQEYVEQYVRRAYEDAWRRQYERDTGFQRP
jgi:hypothetical protein